MIRQLNLGDLAKLERFAKFPMPNVLNPNYFIQIALIDDRSGELVGAALIKKTCEVVMIMDETKSWSTRIRSWTESFDHLDSLGPICDYDDVHAFVVGPNACTHSMLMKKMGFVPATGIPLYYTIGSSLLLKERREEWQKVKRTKQQEWRINSPQLPKQKSKAQSSEDRKAPLVLLA